MVGNMKGEIEILNKEKYTKEHKYLIAKGVDCSEWYKD